LLRIVKQLDRSNCFKNHHRQSTESNNNETKSDTKPAPSEGQIESVCVCSENRKLIRQAIVTLLYLEKDSLKFHKTHCIKYFQLLESRMGSMRAADILIDILADLNIAFNSNFNNNCGNNDRHQLSSDCQKLYDFLNTEIKVLEENLYRSVDDGNFTPYIFRQCDPDHHGQFDRDYDISNDGFEIITPRVSDSRSGSSSESLENAININSCSADSKSDVNNEGVGTGVDSTDE
jgi:hypothetical protein